MASRSDIAELRDSGVHGRGVFALRDIAAGEAVLDCTGRILVAERIDEDIKVMQIGPGVWLAADEEAGDLDNYVNHRCEPNLAFTRGTLTFYALRDIAAGEELFWDYSTSMNEPGWSILCRCGSPGCRGQIQSFCDLLPEVRQRLRSAALDYLR